MWQQFEVLRNKKSRGKLKIVRSEGKQAAIPADDLADFLAKCGNREAYIAAIASELTPTEKLDMLDLAALADAHDASQRYVDFLCPAGFDELPSARSRQPVLN